MSNEIDHIAELEKKLYARDPESVPKRKFGILHPLKEDTSSAWGEPKLPIREPTPQSMRGYKRFFIFAFIFFLFAIAIAAFSYFRGAQTLSSKNVDIAILGSSFTGGGEEFPLQVDIANKNAADLIGATLSVSYPKGATDATGGDVAHIDRVLGTIHSGKTTSEAFSVVLYGEQGSTRTITARISYQLAGASATFQKDVTFPVVIRSSPVTLSAEVPSAVVSNQPFTLSIHTAFSGDTTLHDAVLRVEYPSGFVFTDANIAPAYSNNVWSLGDLQKGADYTITINGRIVGEVNDEKAFRVYVGTPEKDITSPLAVTYNSTLASLVVAEPFLSTDIIVNGLKDDVVVLPVGSAIDGVVQYHNSSPLNVASTTFTLALVGGSVDPETVSVSHGYFDPETQTITWNGISNRDIATIASQSNGELHFSFKTRTPEAGSRAITLALSVKGAFPDRDNLEQSITNAATSLVSFASNMQFSADATHSTGTIKNTGPYPPKANTETTYTVTWMLTPVEDPLGNIVATAVLPTDIAWGGVIVPQGEMIAYNPASRTVTWSVATLPKASPESKKVSTVSFQVKAKPTKAQIGSALTLLGQTTVSATDIATATGVTATADPLTTVMPKDPLYTRGSELVVP